MKVILNQQEGVAYQIRYCLLLMSPFALFAVGQLAARIIAIAFSLVTTLWIFIPNWRLLLRPELLFPTLVFALVNPFLEEAYWRGIIIDSAPGWPRWLAILYSGGLSAINHLIVTVVVATARNPAVWAYQLVLGLLMGVVYTKTRSLRWPIASHAIINMLSFSVPMFLNEFVPGPPG